MTGKERIFKTLRHEKTDKVPWVPFSGIHSGSLLGYNSTEILKDPDKLFESIVKVNELYTPDGQPIIFDLQIEAEIFGCELYWSDENPPSVKSHPLKDNANVPCLCTLPEKEDGRLPIILDVMRRAKAQIGEKTALYGLICGPFTLASHLRGNDFFMDMYDDDEYVKNLMNYCTQVAKKIAKFYIEAGMDVIAVVDPLISQISPNHFEEFCLEPFTDIFSFVKENGAFSSFFVCGDATRNIENMCKTNPDSISVDENINMVKAKEITDKFNIVIGGNIPLTSVMLYGTMQDNMKYVIELLDNVDNQDNLIIAPGCDMPYAVPAENVIAVQQAIGETEKCRQIIENYEAPTDDTVVELADYSNLDRPLIEVFTLDSATCAACGYMVDAVKVAKDNYKDAIDYVEYKISIKENIARIKKMGVKNLPSIYINGELKYSSIIPSRKELFEMIENYL